MLPYVLAGLTTGSVFAVAALGLVLTYKTSGVFNFAQGALASLSAFLFYYLNVQKGLPWPVAAALCVGVAGPLAGLVLERIARQIATADLATRVVVMVGVLLVAQGGISLVFDPGVDRRVPQYLSREGWDINDTRLQFSSVVIFSVGLLATVALYLFFRYAKLGLAMRAVVNDPELLATTGTNPIAVRRWSWMIGVTFASLSGVLIAPLIRLDATTLTFLVVTAFGAAAIGGFSSLPLTYIGALGIGLGQAFLQKEFSNYTDLRAGLSDALPFLVLFGVLLVTPRKRLLTQAHAGLRVHTARSAPRQWQVVGAVVLLLVLAFVPEFAGIHLGDWTHFLAFSMVFLSLGLLTRTSGQVSLCQISFMAIGVAGFSHLAVGQGWPWLVALLMAGLIAVPVGALLAIPAIRLSGLFLALATLGFGILLQRMFYSQEYMFGSLGIGLPMPRPQWSWVDVESDRGYYYFVLVLAILATALVVSINASRLGRLLRAMSDSAVGLSTTGTSVMISRLLVFCISAFLAAVAGAVDGAVTGNVGADGYQPLLSLLMFVLIIICVGREPWYAVMAAAGLILVPSYVTGTETAYWLTLLFGVAGVLYGASPNSLRGPWRSLTLLMSNTGSSSDASGAPGPQAEAEQVSGPGRVSAQRVAPAELTVRQLEVRFGGAVAVADVSLTARTGSVVGLIGPNGAGKTTTFNACTGIIQPTRGRVAINSKSLARISVPGRARLGLGRTFQRMELFDSLTVRENVALGREGAYAGPNPFRHLLVAPGEGKQITEATEHALHLCGIASLSDRRVGTLSTGQRRLVELARCLAGPSSILLLDEPSSGLDRQETQQFGKIISSVVAERGVGVLLVEHDMELVNTICEYIYVLDFGRLIFEGTAAEVTSSPVVQAAYLGSGVEDILGIAGDGIGRLS